MGRVDSYKKRAHNILLWAIEPIFLANTTFWRSGIVATKVNLDHEAILETSSGIAKEERPFLHEALLPNACHRVSIEPRFPIRIHSG